jgi:hypothetical protein
VALLLVVCGTAIAQFYTPGLPALYLKWTEQLVQ